MGKFWLGLVVGFLLFPLLVASYLLLGIAPAETKAPPMPLERLIAGTALRNRISRQSAGREPVIFTTADLVDGARVYRDNCAVCHCAYRESASSIGKSMFPDAPQLLTPQGMTRQPIGVAFWKVDNGIRLTGMPSFESILTEKEKWDVSALIARVDSMPSEAVAVLRMPQDDSPYSSHVSK